MFFFDLLVFSILIDGQYVGYMHNTYKKDVFNLHNILKISKSVENNKIGIVDFRYILKSSNAMKLLGNKFLILEKEINNKIKQKQNFLKQKEEILKKTKTDLTEFEYKKRVKLFKKEVFQIQKNIKMKELCSISLFKKFKKISRIY